MPKQAPGRRRGKESAKDIVVFEIIKASECELCGDEIGKGGLLRMEDGKPLCVECEDLDHPIRLSRGAPRSTPRCGQWW